LKGDPNASPKVENGPVAFGSEQDHELDEEYRLGTFELRESPQEYE
jgi:hypothetical protein